VYTTARAWKALRPWQRYLARVHAYALLHPGAVFSEESAAVLVGLPVYGEPRWIHVFDPSARRSSASGDVIVHAGVDDREILESGPFAFTDVLVTALDLARLLPPAFGLGVVDAVLRPAFLGADGLPLLRERMRELRAHRGRHRAEWVLDHADARAESPAESASRAVAGWCGFAPAELQVEFTTGGVTDRVDFCWPRVRTIGEADGISKYVSGDPGEMARRIRSEKQRENRLRAACSHFTRWGWAEANDPAALARILSAAQVPLVNHANNAMLATLKDHPRSFPRGAESA
jgi:hypothetical protein